MNITFVVSNINTHSKGNGGHYYSMLSTAEALSKNHKVQIINIGTDESLALRNTNFEIINIISEKLNDFILIYHLNKYVKRHPTDVIHAFDQLGYFYARIVSVLRRIPLVLTKCGGVNPRYFPYSQDLINFSQENMQFFQSLRKFRKTKISLIPNRINPFPSDLQRIEALEQKHDLAQYDYVFLRIGRIGSYYQSSLLQLVKTVSLTNQRGVNACALLIGAVENQDVLQLIKEEGLQANLKIESDQKFTRNAKELIDVADVVQGVGRSFQEAALKNKLMLAPLKNSPLPVLVNEKNFMHLLKTNFSERGEIPGQETSHLIDNLLDILYSKQETENYLQKVIPLFQDSFNIETKVTAYEEIYKNKKFQLNNNFVDSVLNYLFVRRKFHQRRNSNK